MTTDARRELVDRLTEGISGLADSDRWRRHLELQATFHRYSSGNVLLIGTQCPEASRVAGYTTWRKLNRTVRKGERAIWIVAPMVVRARSVAEPECDRVVRGFKYVAVFDISQTDGEDLPVLVNHLTGDDPDGRYAALAAVALDAGFSVADHCFGGSTNGDCHHGLHRIRVETHNGGAQRVKTLAHELAHAFLHEQVESVPVAELEAESVAFVVCRALGIDSGRYSFGYVAGWAGGGNEAVAAIKASCDRIQGTAEAILRVVAPVLDSPVSVH